MNRGNLLAIVATAVAAACSGYSNSPSPARPLAYEVPSPPTATYHIADSATVSVDSPMGKMAITSESSVTLALTFESAPGGIRVTGSVEDLVASQNNPMTGTQSADQDDVSGTLDLVMGRRGDVEVTSLPELSGQAAQLFSFPSIAHQLFPRLPDDVVEPGGSWVDTVTWSTTEPIKSTSGAVLTFTLVGDTLVDGRTLLNIAVASEVTGESEIDQGGMPMTHSIGGTATGFVLWDTERGLPAYQYSERAMEGTTTIVGMAPFGMTISGPVRVWLER